MYYRKNPVIIEAIQLRWDTWGEICEFVGVGKLSDGKPEGCYIGENGHPLSEGHTSEEIGLNIPTLEGVMTARQNDWIIKGVNGEFYPCKPDIFKKTYSEVGAAKQNLDDKSLWDLFIGFRDGKYYLQDCLDKINGDMIKLRHEKMKKNEVEPQ